MSGRDEEQAEKILEACARAAHEASISVDLCAEDSSSIAWRQLVEKDRSALRRDAAIALDLIDESAEPTTIESAEEAVERFGCLTNRPLTRANLFMSVVAAVKATLDQEAEDREKIKDELMSKLCQHGSEFEWAPVAHSWRISRKQGCKCWWPEPKKP